MAKCLRNATGSDNAPKTKSARRTVALYPWEARGHTIIASALLQMGDRAGAASALQRAMAAQWHRPEAERLEAAAILDSLRAAGL